MLFNLVFSATCIITYAGKSSKLHRYQWVRHFFWQKKKDAKRLFFTCIFKTFQNTSLHQITNSLDVLNVFSLSLHNLICPGERMLTMGTAVSVPMILFCCTVADKQTFCPENLLFATIPCLQQDCVTVSPLKTDIITSPVLHHRDHLSK